MKRDFERSNMETLVLSFTPIQVVWVPLPLSTVAFKRLSFLLSHKCKIPYCNVMSWLRCHLDFSHLLSAIMFIRGCRSTSGHPLKGRIPASVDLALGRDASGMSKPLFILLIYPLFCMFCCFSSVGVGIGKTLSNSTS